MQLPSSYRTPVSILLSAAACIVTATLFTTDLRSQPQPKEKAKQNALEANNFDFNGNGPGNAQCGSQNIGNVDTGGKIGAAPREVFVFAPNSINLVTGRGCQ